MIGRSKGRVRLCAALLCLNLLFIWGNSLLPGEVSAALSQWVKDLLAKLFSGGPGGEAGHGLLRKLAHFSEFALLGVLLSWLLGMLRGKASFRPLLPGVTAACLDEGIQLFVPGRAARLTDILIDSGGVLVGMALFLLWLLIKVRKNKKNENNMKPNGGK